MTTLIVILTLMWLWVVAVILTFFIGVYEGGSYVGLDEEEEEEAIRREMPEAFLVAELEAEIKTLRRLYSGMTESFSKTVKDNADGMTRIGQLEVSLAQRDSRIKELELALINRSKSCENCKHCSEGTCQVRVSGGGIYCWSKGYLKWESDDEQRTNT